MSYEEDVLIKLRRKYSKDEKIAVSRIQKHPMWIQQKNLIKKRGEEKENLRKKNLELSREIHLLTKKLQENDN